ncbi:MAG: VTT domain-containing protein [Candidatus Paceibacterota bacterium]|jgi:membrane protein DedA with SNARE-associated domain
MFLSSSDISFFLEQYKYLLIFPIAVFEGPIVTVISGFFIYLGLLNIYIVYILLAVGDLTGDVLHYVVGRYWQKSVWIKKHGSWFGYDENSEEFLENHFRKHKIKTLLAAKFFHGTGTVIQITAGIAKVNFLQYLWINLIMTILKTSALLFLGYYIGSSYIKIDGYLNIIGFIVISIIIVVLSFIISSKLAKKYLIKSE